MAQQSFNLTLSQYNAAFGEFKALEKSKAVINPLAGFWLGILKQKLYPIAKGYSEQCINIFNKVSKGAPKKGEGYELSAKQAKEYNDMIKKVGDTNYKLDVEMIPYNLLTKEEGTDSLPASFWTNLAVHFVAQPAEKKK